MKRLVSFILSLILAVAIFVPVMSGVSYAASDVRTAMPSYTSSAGKTYYYSDNNLFYKYNLGRIVNIIVIMVDIVLETVLGTLMAEPVKCWGHH